MEQNQDNIETNELSGEWSSSFESQLAQALSDESTDVIPQRYGYRIGSLGLMVSEDKLAEVAMDVAIHSIPNTRKWFAGMVNMRGNLVPVFDIGMLLGEQFADDKKQSKRSILILDSGELSVGMLVDGLPVTVDVGRPSNTASDVPELLRDFVEKVYDDQAQMWLEVDIERFMEHVGSLASQPLGNE